MSKNIRFGALALLLALGAAACGGDAAEEAEVPAERQVVVPTEEPAIVVDPAVTQGAVMMDTSNAGAAMEPAVNANPADTLPDSSPR